MRSVSFASVLALLVCVTAWSASAKLVPCDSILRALARGSDPETVAADLGTTRARVNACAKLDETQNRMVDQRAELHRERRARGLE